MKFSQNNLLNKAPLLKGKGLRLFQAGIFLLPSAPAISVFLLFISMIISSVKRTDKYFKDPWNYPLIITSILMLISCLLSAFKEHTYLTLENIHLVSWIDLANWLPLFLCFWFLQPYLDTKENRRTCALAFMCGSVPVLISGFGQYWFNWHGPFDLFNGLIIWYQRPISTGGGLSGLFNNANYAGALLTMILPFSLAAVTEKKRNFFKFLLVLSISIAIITAVVLTNSRNAWLGLIICLPLIFGSKKILITLLAVFSTIFVSSNIFTHFNNLIKLITPSRMLANFDFNLIVSDPRVEIWEKAINYISANPLFGYGGSGFGSLERKLAICQGGSCHNHAHNLPLELSLKYGLPTAIILSITILILLFFGFRKVSCLLKIDLFERAWITSLFIILISHLFDIQYFDIRISLFCWILLAGTKNLITERNTNSYEK